MLSTLHGGISRGDRSSASCFLEDVEFGPPGRPGEVEFLLSSVQEAVYSICLSVNIHITGITR
jgi:hypothetical protein